MHATVSDWAHQLIMTGVRVGAFGEGDLCLLARGRTVNFRGHYQNIVKAPDIAIVPGDRFWPTIVFEFGYEEPYEHMKDDVKLLLEGSEGAISKVIVIKLQSLEDNDTEIKGGFVEMWHFSDGNAKKVGGRKKLFPSLMSHGTQKLELPLGDILRSEFRNLANEGWERENTIDLYLDLLRAAINKATTRHLIAQGVLPEPSLHGSDSDSGSGLDNDE
ncbi:hypothetical protein HOY82DRAFT_89612 [Tuber indicum]|nr:hypothetical protein HOY82DRAFT_89612 [Tuber indicum]